MSNKVFWFTGLSGAGKTTLAKALTVTLEMWHASVIMIDGDEFRKKHCPDLGFSNADRHENLMRMSDYALKLSEQYQYVVVAAISPLHSTRSAVREKLGNLYTEIFVDTPLSVCEKRDVKGLYARARAGLIDEFTGISSPYETPINPNIRIPYPMDIQQALNKILMLKMVA